MTNLLEDVEGRATFGQYMVSDFWTGSVDEEGYPVLSARVETLEDVPYTLEFSMAANLVAGATDVALEVEFAGESIGLFTHSGAVYGTQEIDLVGTGTEETLTFRVVDVGSDTGGPVIDTDGVIPSYAKTVDIAGESVELKAFAAGQSNLYQVLHGQLVKFDLETATYTQAEVKNDLPLNAIGVNVEDDLLYGLATADGADSRGTALSRGDLVAIDATGATFRIGETPYSTYIGDFDDEGNLWVFGGGLSYAAVIDVDETGPDGNPAVTHYELSGKLPNGINGLADLAYNAETQTFYGVGHRGKNGKSGDLVAVDVSGVATGGEPEISLTKLDGILVDGEVRNQIPSTAFGAAMVDAEGNVYVGANNGDHDGDRKTPDSGGLYKVTEMEDGALVLELLSESPSVRINDGAMDTRAFDPFLGIDTSSEVLLRAPELTIAIAEDDTVALASNGDTATVDLLANDFVSEGGELSVLSIGGVAFVPGEEITLGDGTRLTLNDDFTVTASPGLLKDTRETSVAYTISDANGVTDTGTLTVLVSPVDGTAGDDSMMRGHTDADGNIVDGADGPHDVIMGWAGNDKIFSYDGDDIVYGGTGDDFIRGYAGSDTIHGEDGDDFLCGSSGADHVSAGAGDDIVFVDDAGDTIEDGGGTDTVKSTVSWALSDDFEHLWLKGDAAVGSGNAADNTIVGNAAANTLAGHGGDDRILAGAGDDVADGGGGADRIDGNEGNDVIAGGDGRDKIDGGEGADLIDGGAGDDIIDTGTAEGAADTVIGGHGDDILYADDGPQRFVFREGDGADRMKSFESGVDTLVFEGMARDDLKMTVNAGGAVIRYGSDDVLILSLCAPAEADFDFI